MHFQILLDLDKCDNNNYLWITGFFFVIVAFFVRNNFLPIIYQRYNYFSPNLTLLSHVTMISHCCGFTQ